MLGYFIFLYLKKRKLIISYEEKQRNSLHKSIIFSSLGPNMSSTTFLSQFQSVFLLQHKMPSFSFIQMYIKL